MNQDRDPIRIRARHILSNGWSKLERVTFDQPGSDGSWQTVDREVYHRGPAVAVLPIDRVRGTVLLVRQLRLPAYLNGDGAALIEACAGLIDDDDDAVETVRREAGEEIGCTLHAVRKLFTLYMSPGACTEKLHLFAAEYGPADRFAEGGGLAGEGEQIEVLEIPFDEAWEMVLDGRIIDAKTVVLIQQARFEGI